MTECVCEWYCICILGALLRRLLMEIILGGKLRKMNNGYLKSISRLEAGNANTLGQELVSGMEE